MCAAIRRAVEKRPAALHLTLNRVSKACHAGRVAAEPARLFHDRRQGNPRGATKVVLVVEHNSRVPHVVSHANILLGHPMSSDRSRSGVRPAVGRVV